MMTMHVPLTWSFSLSVGDISLDAQEPALGVVDASPSREPYAATSPSRQGESSSPARGGQGDEELTLDQTIDVQRLRCGESVSHEGKRSPSVSPPRSRMVAWEEGDGTSVAAPHGGWSIDAPKLYYQRWGMQGRRGREWRGWAG